MLALITDVLNKVKLINKPCATYFGADVSVAVDTYVTIKERTATAKGHLLGFWFLQGTSSGRTINKIKITIDGTEVESTGLYVATAGTPFTTVVTGDVPRWIPCMARYKSSFKLEVAGTSSPTGTFHCSAVWTEEN